MLELYFRPFACSLASRIVLLEAGLDARYHQVDLARQVIVPAGIPYASVATKGKVPALRLEDGSLLTENVAVLQYLADRRPEAGLAGPPGASGRYRLQEWLSFIATELHKPFLYLTFTAGTPEEVRAHARELVPRALGVVADPLTRHQHLLGEDFSVADAYLTWALLLARLAGVDLSAWQSLAAYLERVQDRPSVAKALAVERPLLQTNP